MTISANASVLSLISDIAAQARQDAYAAYPKAAGPKYCRMDEPITQEFTRGHLSNEAPIACHFFLGEGVTTAVLDLDGHGKSMNWSQVAEAARPALERLKAEGMTLLCCRSGGGAEMHIWLFCAAPQKAKLVQKYQCKEFAAADYKNGTGGVLQREIEVFPKNDHVKEEHCGNTVAHS